MKKILNLKDILVPLKQENFSGNFGNIENICYHTYHTKSQWDKILIKKKRSTVSCLKNNFLLHRKLSTGHETFKQSHNGSNNDQSIEAVNEHFNRTPTMRVIWICRFLLSFQSPSKFLSFFFLRLPENGGLGDLRGDNVRIHVRCRPPVFEVACHQSKHRE